MARFSTQVMSVRGCSALTQSPLAFNASEMVEEEAQGSPEALLSLHVWGDKYGSEFLWPTVNSVIGMPASKMFIFITYFFFLTMIFYFVLL